MNELKRYCLYCKHHTTTNDKGAICGLTNKKPSFSNQCVDFKFSPEKRAVQAALASKNSKFIYTWEDFVFKYLHKRIEDKDLKTAEVKFSITKFILFFIGILIGVSYIVATIIYTHNVLLIIYAVALFFVALMMLAFYINDILDRIKGKPILAFSEKGLFLRGKSYKWGEVGYIRFYPGFQDDYTDSGGHRSTQPSKIFIGLIGKRELIFKTKFFDTSRQDLFRIVKSVNSTYLSDQTGQNQKVKLSSLNANLKN